MSYIWKKALYKKLNFCSIELNFVCHIIYTIISTFDPLFKKRKVFTNQIIIGKSLLKIEIVFYTCSSLFGITLDEKTSWLFPFQHSHSLIQHPLINIWIFLIHSLSRFNISSRLVKLHRKKKKLYFNNLNRFTPEKKS